MSNAFFRVPEPVNEPVLSYAPGSPERHAVQARLAAMQAQEIEVPLFIGGQAIKTGDVAEMRAPHDHSIKLGVYHKAGEREVKLAIEAALDARSAWAAMPWEHRLSIFLKAAELLAGAWRQILNAATMLGQSKTVFQAEIDAACEIIDFWRFNAHYMTQIMAEQPISGPGVWNRVEYRPLEGFVFAVTPFNFTSIAGNLPTAPAMVGNVVLWKPASSAVYSAYYHHATAARGRAARRRDQLRARLGAAGRRSGAGQPGSGRHPLHRLDAGLPGHVEDRRRDHAQAQVLSAHRRRDRRQGFHLRPSARPRSMPW